MQYSVLIKHSIAATTKVVFFLFIINILNIFFIRNISFDIYYLNFKYLKIFIFMITQFLWQKQIIF